jgi:hypothetical protein
MQQLQPSYNLLSVAIASLFPRVWSIPPNSKTISVDGIKDLDFARFISSTISSPVF